MKKNMHNNSLDAYAVISDSLEPREKKIMSHLRCIDRAITIRELARALEYYDLNEVRPRVTALKEAGLIVECDRVIDQSTGRRVMTIRAAA